MTAEGTTVAGRVTVRDLCNGHFLDLAPAGAPITIASIDILRLANGEVQEHRGVLDQIAMIRQVGVLAAYGA